MKTCSRCKEEKPRSEFYGPKKSQCKDCTCLTQRESYQRNIEKRRKDAREYKRQEYADPERRRRLLKTRAKWRDSGRSAEWRRKDKRKHFFKYKAQRQRHSSVTAESLAALWKSQRGRCALSGRKLDRSAHLDHIIPRAQGGADSIENFQWLDPIINLAKGDQTDQEFIQACQEVLEWNEN